MKYHAEFSHVGTRAVTKYFIFLWQHLNFYLIIHINSSYNKYTKFKDMSREPIDISKNMSLDMMDIRQVNQPLLKNNQASNAQNEQGGSSCILFSFILFNTWTFSK